MSEQIIHTLPHTTMHQFLSTTKKYPSYLTFYLFQSGKNGEAVVFRNFSKINEGNEETIGKQNSMQKTASYKIQ